ncbi:MAG: diaminopimelate epimerase [Verrucomicrobia bacterium]|nr:diaminopimelate epimerase [Verrucomicrobiota bacterium]MBV9658106.1 diaminopimelate epimerase [Verrucomicrobiota bacterium]
MQKLAFAKMNGAGNDFVLLDNRASHLALDRAAVARLCDRHRGVGADGVLIVEPPAIDGPRAHYRMRYYNADGGEVEMCGNGARCFARFAAHLDAGGNGASRERHGELAFQTIAGVIHARIEGEEVALVMSQPKDGRDVSGLIVAEEILARLAFLNTGVPHVVAQVADTEKVDVPRLGAALRYHEEFAPAGTNANFMQWLGPREIRVRTYERGVEGETLACGTGCVASALIFAETNSLAAGPVAVQVRGGDTLRVGFQRTGPFAFENVTLTGPADFVFHGEIAV